MLSATTPTAYKISPPRITTKSSVTACRVIDRVTMIANAAMIKMWLIVLKISSGPNTKVPTSRPRKIPANT